MLFNEQKIITAIENAEQKTSGEIRVHMAGHVFGDIYKKGKTVFEKLGMTSTRERNGILFFIAEKSHKFAILGDTGIHQKVHQEFWDELTQVMVQHFKKGEFNEGLCQAILACGEKLVAYFPRTTTDKNELTNQISRG